MQHLFKLPMLENGSFLKILQSWILIAVGVIIAANTSDGIEYEHESALFLVVIVLSFLNLVLKPLLLFFTLPFILVSLGLGIWIINALLFLLASKIVQGFVVDSFGAALWGALVVSLTSIVANMLIRKTGSNRPRASNHRQPSNKNSNEDIIDI